MNPPPIRTSDFVYSLPEDRIPLFPLPQRDNAKLLVCRQGKISHHAFHELPELLPHNSLLFLNDSRVIPARFLFEKDTGASIEVFLLQPLTPSPLLSNALGAGHPTTWKCAVGNVRRWPEGLALQRKEEGITLTARLIEKSDGIVEFTWTPDHLAFASVLRTMGMIPLPPYLNRKAEETDKVRYQTIYSTTEGAVAAPTAGLHFSEDVLDKIRAQNIKMDFLTLHVGPGTFLPVKTENAMDHPMHEEQVIVRRRNIENLLLPETSVIAVGTTSMRTLESLYWYGALLLRDAQMPFVVDKLLPYRLEGKLPGTRESFRAILSHMDKLGLDELTGRTSIYIFPGYNFRVCEGLITNFHQPGSTLLLLVAAFIGPAWKKIYREALDRHYRFLSYGDSSLLLP